MSYSAIVKPRPADLPTFAERLVESMPWIGFVFVAGPPVVFLAIPCVVLALSLVWAFTLLFALLAALGAVVAALGFAGALLASPFVLVGRVRARRRARADVGGPTSHLVAVGSPRAIA
jgi:hypothetical protein